MKDVTERSIFLQSALESFSKITFTECAFANVFKCSSIFMSFYNGPIDFIYKLGWEELKLLDFNHVKVTSRNVWISHYGLLIFEIQNQNQNCFGSSKWNFKCEIFYNLQSFEEKWSFSITNFWDFIRIWISDSSLFWIFIWK